MILVFVTLLFMPLTEPNVEKTTVEALNQQKIKDSNSVDKSS